MSQEWLDRGRANVYVIPKVEKGFGHDLGELLSRKLGREIEPLRLDADLTDWVVARAAGKKRSKSDRSPGTKALWRAFRALAAARYHVREEAPLADELLKIRNRIEEMWMARL